MGEVVRFTGETTPNDPDSVLDAAKGKDFADVIVIGLHDADNPKLWLTTSTSGVERVIYLLERAKRQLFKTVFPD